MHDVERTGPLTQEQLQELRQHPCEPMDLEEVKQEQRFHRNIIQCSDPNDPAARRSLRELSNVERYLHLKERYLDYGVAVTLESDPHVSELG